MSKTGEDMRADKGAYDSEEVLNSVGSHLDALMAKSGDSPTPKPEEDVDDLETEDDSTPEDDQADDGSLNQDEDADDTGEEAEDAPAIPEQLLRAAQYNEWTVEEATEFWKANPKVAEKTFEKMHKTMNDMSRQFAEFGRTRIKMERQQQQDRPAAQPQQQIEDVVDIKALREADPDNPLLPIVEGMNKALKQLTPRQDAAQPEATHNDGTQNDLALAQQIITFIGADQMKPYGDFYGPAYDQNQMPTFDIHALTPGQAANRRALIDRADEIYIGAKMHGRELSVEEALQMAHSLLTDGMRSQKIREDLVGKVRKRSRGMTLRPTSKGLPAAKEEGQQLTDDQIENRAEARLAKLRGKI